MKDKIIEILNKHKIFHDDLYGGGSEAVEEDSFDEIAAEIESICYPKEFVIWMGRLEENLTCKGDEWTIHWAKGDKYYILDELYQYWLKNIDK